MVYARPLFVGLPVHDADKANRCEEAKSFAKAAILEEASDKSANRRIQGDIPPALSQHHCEQE